MTRAVSAHASGLIVESISGHAIEQYLDDLAALRIEVFREYPYLYEGSRSYEQSYLRAYAASPRSVVVLARDADKVVGAATAMPLEEHAEEVAPALAAAGFDPARCYYFGESVLRAKYRGRGLGHAFFDGREAAARQHGFSIATFCAVERPLNHPRKPADYVPHDVFWNKRGYVKRPDIVASFSWRDLDEAEQSAKPMLFWIKELAQ
jgi:GNAT superfamily N-acetyltransferase